MCKRPPWKKKLLLENLSLLIECITAKKKLQVWMWQGHEGLDQDRQKVSVWSTAVEVRRGEVRGGEAWRGAWS